MALGRRSYAHATRKPARMKILFIILAILVGLGADIWLGSALWQFRLVTLTLPHGASVRPVGVAWAAMVAAGIGLVFGVPLSLVGMFLKGHLQGLWGWSLSITGLLLCLSPFPLYCWLYGLIIESRGLVID